MTKPFTSPFDEDNDTLGHEVMDITFQIFDHDRNDDCWEHYGDHIYDAYSDVFNEEIVDFEVYGQGIIEEVNLENLHDILHPYELIYDEDFGQSCEDFLPPCTLIPKEDFLHHFLHNIGFCVEFFPA